MPEIRISYFYKISLLERALIDLRTGIMTAGGCYSLHFTPTQCAVLLEAARIGASEIYRNHALLDGVRIPYP